MDPHSQLKLLDIALNNFNEQSVSIPSPNILHELTAALDASTYSALPPTSRDSLFKCHICTTTFSKKSNLTRHLRVIHDDHRPHVFSVPNCDARFAFPSYLTAHYRSTHKGEKLFPCKLPNCSRSFVNSSNRNKHMRTVRHSTS